MAGGNSGKLDPKLQKILKNGFSSEVLNDSQGGSFAQKSETKAAFSLSGVLSLGKTTEINKSAESTKKTNEKVFFGLNHLEQEQKVIFDQKQQQLEKNINELREEIHQLIKSTNQLEKQVEVAAITSVVEYNEYQINFLDRIRLIVANFRKNISEASLWLDSFSKKKKKKNAFWSKAKDKKRGGEQYLFSSEHSVARSAN